MPKQLKQRYKLKHKKIIDDSGEERSWFLITPISKKKGKK